MQRQDENYGDLQALIEALAGEAGRISVQGRALSDEERARVDAIQRALPLLRQAAIVLEGGPSEEASAASEEAAAAEEEGLEAPAKASDLASAVLFGGKVRFATQHSSGVNDDATPDKQMAAAAQGKKVSRSSYGNAPGGTVALSGRMLQGMLSLSKVFTFSVSEIAGGAHSQNSRHYAGIGFDVTHVNGVRVKAGAAHWQSFLQRAQALGAQERLGPGAPGHATHVHVAWPRQEDSTEAPGAEAVQCETPAPDSNIL